MSKPIQEDIFRSRLTITYRTNITGTPQEETLPYRLLVLGEFEGAHERDIKGVLPPLAERRVGSIRRSTSVKNHMRELQPNWAIPKGKLDNLRSQIPGRVTFLNLRCLVPEAGPAECTCALQGEATFKSDPNDNGNLGVLEGKLTVTGNVTLKKDKNKGYKVDSGTVYLRGVASGKLTAGSSNGTVDIATARIDILLEEADLTRFEVVDYEGEPTTSGMKRYDVRYVSKESTELPVRAERTVPFTSVNCFSPDDVVLSIPELQRLRVIKGLVLELQGMLRNRVDLREALKAMLPSSSDGSDKKSEKLSRFKNLRSWAQSEMRLLQIEQHTQETKPTKDKPEVASNG